MEFEYFYLAMPGVLNIRKTWGGGGEGVTRLKPHVPMTCNITFKTDYCYFNWGSLCAWGQGAVASPRPLTTKNTYLLTLKKK